MYKLDNLSAHENENNRLLTGLRPVTNLGAKQISKSLSSIFFHPYSVHWSWALRKWLFSGPSSVKPAISCGTIDVSSTPEHGRHIHSSGAFVETLTKQVQNEILLNADNSLVWASPCGICVHLVLLLDKIMKRLLLFHLILDNTCMSVPFARFCFQTPTKEKIINRMLADLLSLMVLFHFEYL